MEKGTEFTRVLKDLRQYRELSLKRLAEAAQLHPSYLSRLEGGERIPSKPVIEKLAKALNIGPGDSRYDALMKAAGYLGSEERITFACMELNRLNQLFPLTNAQTQIDLRLALRLLLDGAEARIRRANDDLGGGY